MCCLYTETYGNVCKQQTVRDILFLPLSFWHVSQRGSCRRVIIGTYVVMPYSSCESISTEVTLLNSTPSARLWLYWCQIFICLGLGSYFTIKLWITFERSSLKPLDASPIQVFNCPCTFFFNLYLSSRVFCWICISFHLCPVLDSFLPTWDNIWPASQRVGRSSCTEFIQYEVPCSRTSQVAIAWVRPKNRFGQY